MLCPYSIFEKEREKKMNIFTGNYNSIFGSGSPFYSNSNKSSGLGIESLLSDYSSIKRGTYGKLMKSYYHSQQSADTTNASNSKATNKLTYKSASADNAEQIQKLKSVSSELTSSASALYSSSANSLYEKGNEDKLYKAVSSFVDDYNDMVKTAGDSNNNKVTRNVSTMNNAVSASSRLLSKAGISVNSDKTLAIDEETFKKADTSTIKTLFSGNRSLAYQTGTSSSFINMYASQDAAKSSGLYNNRGVYSSFNTGMLFDSIF